MAAEHETPISLYFKMTVAVLWRNELKIEYGEDYEKKNNRLFVILGWLGRANLGNPFVASCDRASYLKFSVSKYVLSYVPRIFINYNRFPYEEDTVDEWFVLPPGKVKLGRGKKVQAINFIIKNFKQELNRIQHEVERVTADLLKDDEFEVFFHGTSHESATIIIADGIDLTKGAKKKDFSDGDGFYLGKDFDKALDWAKIKHRPELAVLVFRLNKTELRGEDNERGYDLRNPALRDQWDNVIKKFRDGDPDDDFLGGIEHYHFIEGPMASCSRENPVGDNPREKPNFYQLCVREENCASLFDRNLHSAVFLYLQETEHLIPRSSARGKSFADNRVGRKWRA